LFLIAGVEYGFSPCRFFLREILSTHSFAKPSVKLRKAMVESVALYGNELWGLGEGKQRSAEGAVELQKPVNRKARAVTGRLEMTNLGALATESC